MDVLTGGIGDGVCDSADKLTSSTVAVDVYLDTNHNADPVPPATCSDGVHPLDIFSYDLIIGADETFGSVIFDSWTNARTGYASLNAFTSSGGVMSVGYSKPSGSDPTSGNPYKLGTIGLTVTGEPSLFFLTEPPSPAFPSPVTGFGSTCEGTFYPNTITLGIDFFDNCA
jgi:hypothetical protein